MLVFVRVFVFAVVSFFAFRVFAVEVDDKTLELYFNQEEIAEEHSDKSLEEAYKTFLEQEAALRANQNQRLLFSNDYNVNGGYHSYIRPECHYIFLSKILNATHTFTSEKAKEVQSWVNTCQKELSRFRGTAVESLIRFSSVKYPIQKNPKLEFVNFTYDKNKYLARGILGLKDNQKRPLVIVKNGLYGQANEESISKNFFMHLFDESPFHVLFLGNMTGKDFLLDNGHVALGGYDEGRQLHEVIKQLLDTKTGYGNLIEDVHMVGVSLGGNAALFSSLYSSYLHSSSATKLKSVIAVCPVVNLEKSFNHMFSGSIVGRVNGLYANSYVKDVFNGVPDLAYFLTPGKYWTRSEVSNAISGSASYHYIRKTQNDPWDYLPFVGDKISSVQDVWDRNNFLDFAKDIRVPTLVLHSNDDPIVRSKENSNLLSGVLGASNSHLGIVGFDNGGHCGYNVANGWPTMSTMLREFILSHSSYQVDNKASNGALSFQQDIEKEQKRIKDLQVVNYEWIASERANTVDFKVSFFKPEKWFLWFKTCHGDYRFANASECYYSRTYKVKLSSFKDLKLQAPRNDYEANAMSRWMNTHVTPTSKGFYPYGQSLIPDGFYVHKH